MKRLLCLLVFFLLASCSAPPTQIPITPTQTATATSAPTDSPTATLIPPTMTPTRIPPSVEYNQRILSALPASEVSCLPAKTDDDLGIYIYDLKQNQELVSINADVPFQFASAFKAPVMTYFLTQCKKYWDTSSPEWQAYFQQAETARNIPYYSSPEYKALLAEHFANVKNWDNIETFFDANRFINAGGLAEGIDNRYFILGKAYSMTTRSNNYATGEILQFVFDNCAAPAQPVNAPQCHADNAISRFNAWFNQFSGIAYQSDAARRGLFEWDTVIEKDAKGNPYEAAMITSGQKDLCASQTAQLNCSAATGLNVWSARDFFKFYDALYRLDDVRVRDTALNLLAVDNEGTARGNLKNLARKMGAVSMSKNGHAHFILGSINTDAGLFYYQDTPFIVVVLGYDAQPSLSLLYGDYDPKGEPLIDVSLIRDVLDDYLNSQ